METIVAIDLGKSKSVFCEFDRASLKTQYRTVRTRPEVFHDIFAELDPARSVVLFACEERTDSFFIFHPVRVRAKNKK